MGPLTEKFGVGLEATGSYSAEPPSHPNGSHVCELEVDPDTGEVTVDRYFVVDDLGRVLNPMIVRGQIHGGVMQGIGQALIEHQIYDRQSGQLLTGSFMDYGMPRADMMPDVEATLEEVPCKTNPLGVKGIGESGTIGAPPTVINALIDALKPLGVERHRHAGDAGAGVGNHPAGAGRRAGWTLTVVQWWRLGVDQPPPLSLWTQPCSAPCVTLSASGSVALHRLAASRRLLHS